MILYYYIVYHNIILYNVFIFNILLCCNIVSLYQQNKFAKKKKKKNVCKNTELHSTLQEYDEL